MRIAAKRSFRKYRLEGPNPEFLMVYEGVRLRSTEVDRERSSSTESAKVFGAFFLVVLMDFEAQTLSELRSFSALSVCVGFGSCFY